MVTKFILDALKFRNKFYIKVHWIAILPILSIAKPNRFLLFFNPELSNAASATQPSVGLSPPTPTQLPATPDFNGVNRTPEAASINASVEGDGSGRLALCVQCT